MRGCGLLLSQFAVQSVRGSKTCTLVDMKTILHTLRTMVNGLETWQTIPESHSNQWFSLPALPLRPSDGLANPTVLLCLVFPSSDGDDVLYLPARWGHNHHPRWFVQDHGLKGPHSGGITWKFLPEELERSVKRWRFLSSALHTEK